MVNEIGFGTIPTKTGISVKPKQKDTNVQMFTTSPITSGDTVSFSGSKKPENVKVVKELSKGYSITESNGKFGMQKEGKEIIPPQYENLKPEGLWFSGFEKNVFEVSIENNGKKGLFAYRHGNEIFIKPNYNSIKPLKTGNMHDCDFIVNGNQVINSKEEKISKEYKKISPGEYLFTAQTKENKTILLDRKGKELTKPVDKISDFKIPFNHKNHIAENDGKVGIISINKDKIKTELPIEYDGIEYLTNGLITVKKDDKIGLAKATEQGIKLIHSPDESKYKEASFLETLDTAPIVTLKTDDGKITILDDALKPVVEGVDTATLGKVRVKGAFNSLHEHEDMLKVTKNGSTGLYQKYSIGSTNFKRYLESGSNEYVDIVPVKKELGFLENIEPTQETFAHWGIKADGTKEKVQIVFTSDHEGCEIKKMED